MEIYQFFKANIAGKGYTKKWANKPSGFELSTTVLENSMPHPATNTKTHQIAYAASRLQGNKILIAVGCYWPNHSDQYGRAGLSFWHGAVCSTNQIDSKTMHTVSTLLLSLVQRYQVNYETLGNIVAQIAVNDKLANWMNSFTQLLTESSRLDHETLEIMDHFVRHYEKIPKPANLQLGFPLNEDLAIPLLLTSLKLDTTITHVAGGQLAPLTLEQAQQISAPKNMPGFEAFKVSRLLLEGETISEPEIRHEDGGNRRGILFSSIAGLTILALLIIILGLIRANSTTKTICTVSSANDQAFFKIRLYEAPSNNYSATLVNSDSKPIIGPVSGSCDLPLMIDEQSSDTTLDCAFNFNVSGFTQKELLDTSLLIEGQDSDDQHAVLLSACLIN